MFEQEHAVADIAGFDLFDRRLFGLRRCTDSVMRLLASGNALSHFVDERVHLRFFVPVVQPPLELIAQQSAQRLAVADSFDELQRDAHPRRRDVHGKSVRCGRDGVAEIAAAEHGSGDRVVQRRRQNVAAVGRISVQRQRPAAAGRPPLRAALRRSVRATPSSRA